MGAAWYDSVSLQTGVYRLPPLATVYLAEAYAVLEALRHVQDCRIENPLILTDSQSVLQALKGASPGATTPEIIVQARRLALEIQEEGTRIAFAWVPAHSGIPPNEAADAAANIARVEGQETELNLPPTAYYQERKQTHIQTSQSSWDDPGAPGRHLQKIEKRAARNSIWFARVDSGRRAVVTLIRWRIGHALTPAYKKRISQQEDAICPRCGEDDADLLHLVDACPFTDRVEYEDHLNRASVGLTLEEDLKNPESAVTAVERLLEVNSHLRF